MSVSSSPFFCFDDKMMDVCVLIGTNEWNRLFGNKIVTSCKPEFEFESQKSSFKFVAINALGQNSHLRDFIRFSSCSCDDESVCCEN